METIGIALLDKILRLDQKSQLPLHIQAEKALRKLIQRPEFRAGRLLPDEISLSRSLGISRNTLRTAIGRLVSEGRLERKAGVGTRVIEPRVHSGVGAWQSFTREMEAKGIKVETYRVKVHELRPPREIASALQIDPDSQVFCLDRLRGWDGQPEVYFRSFLHPRLKLPMQADFQRPLYELIREYCSILADQSQEELSAVAADYQLANWLGVNVGTPLLRRDRVVLDAGRRPIEAALVHYRCDRFRLTLNLRQE